MHTKCQLLFKWLYCIWKLWNSLSSSKFTLDAAASFHRKWTNSLKVGKSECFTRRYPFAIRQFPKALLRQLLRDWTKVCRCVELAEFNSDVEQMNNFPATKYENNITLYDIIWQQEITTWWVVAIGDLYSLKAHKKSSMLIRQV